MLQKGFELQSENISKSIFQQSQVFMENIKLQYIFVQCLDLDTTFCEILYLSVLSSFQKITTKPTKVLIRDLQRGSILFFY